MALTNDQITAKNFQEFYQQILPYLGGMPDILANKFARGDMYSTDEKMIGQWIDGKPLYQKTITGKCPNSSTPKTYAHNIANVDMIKVSDAFMSWGNDIYSPIPVYSASTSVPISTACITIPSVDRTEIKLRADEDRSAYDFYITVQYTKTTDSAVDIGDDTDYSTTEKIVGTWIDGKPLYQKTIDVQNTRIDGSTLIAHNITNLDYVLSAVGSFNRTSDTLLIPYGISSGAIALFIESINNTNIKIKGSDYQGATDYLHFYITLQYTKTTD